MKPRSAWLATGHGMFWHSALWSLVPLRRCTRSHAARGSSSRPRLPSPGKAPPGSSSSRSSRLHVHLLKAVDPLHRDRARRRAELVRVRRRRHLKVGGVGTGAAACAQRDRAHLAQRDRLLRAAAALVPAKVATLMRRKRRGTLPGRRVDAAGGMQRYAAYRSASPTTSTKRDCQTYGKAGDCFCSCPRSAAAAARGVAPPPPPAIMPPPPPVKPVPFVALPRGDISVVPCARRTRRFVLRRERGHVAWCVAERDAASQVK